MLSSFEKLEIFALFSLGLVPNSGICFFGLYVSSAEFIIAFLSNIY